uniref:Uncharacterized protein n=1 Tax=Trichogramma kaykai TaxID=54128 RepID=A0ABD2VRU6_9HYME
MSFIGFWATVELLVALESVAQASSRHPFDDEVDDWLDNVSKSQQQITSRELELQQRGSPSAKLRSSKDDDAASVDYRNTLNLRWREDETLRFPMSKRARRNGAAHARRYEIFLDVKFIAFSYCPVKSRLEGLMNSSVVRLTDRKYMLKLMSRIRQDYESKQEARIEERKYAELMRTKKLILYRFIPVQEAPPEICEYPLFKLYLYCEDVIAQRLKKRLPKRAKIPKSLYKLLYPEKPTEVADEVDEEVPMKEILVNGEPTMVPMKPDEIEAMRKEQELAKEIEEGYMFTKEEYDSLHYETDAVKKLREAKTINEMYDRANNIVGALFSLLQSPSRHLKTADGEAVSTKTRA